MQKIIISILSTVVVIWNELRDRNGKNRDGNKGERRKK
jgi:hypothetical protein